MTDSKMDWYQSLAFVLFAVGVLLLVGEFFLPTGGVLIVGAVGLFAAAVGVLLYYGGTLEAVAAVIALAVGLPVAGAAAVRTWSRMALRSSLSAPDPAAAPPEPVGLAALKGRFGRTVSPMRPSGSVVVDGRRVDALTEGMMLDANVWVKCVDVRAGRLIVRQVDAPAELKDLELDDLT